MNKVSDTVYLIWKAFSKTGFTSPPVNIVSSRLWAPQIVMSFYEEEHGQRKTIHQLIVASVSGKARDESAESEATRVHG